MSSGGFLQDYGSVLGPDGGDDDDDDDERDTDGEVWKLRHSLTRNQPQRQNEGIRLNEGIPAGRGSSNPHLYNQPRKMYQEGRLHIGQPRPLSEYTGATEPRNIKILGLYPEVHRDVMIPTQTLRVHEPPPPYHAQNFYIYPGRPGTLLYPPRSPGLIDLPLANPAEGPMFTPIAEPRSRSESKDPEEGGKYAVCSLSLAIAACICGSFLCSIPAIVFAWRAHKAADLEEKRRQSTNSLFLSGVALVFGGIVLIIIFVQVFKDWTNHDFI